MIYRLVFTKISNKEWKKLAFPIKTQLKKKLNERLENPKIKKDKISGYKNIYKIKLKSAGYRLIYEVKDSEIIVLVLTVGKRENSDVYSNLREKIEENE